MKNERKIFIYSVLIIIAFLASFILFFNDYINYSMISFTITILLIIIFCTLIFTKKDDRSVYLRKLTGILKNYDADIIYLNDEYIIKDKDVLFVNDMDDLLIASVENKLPIIYLNEEHSATFLVESDTELLVYILKENNDEISNYEHKLMKYIENNTKSKKVLLNNINEETIIKLDNKFYKVTPMN